MAASSTAGESKFCPVTFWNGVRWLHLLAMAFFVGGQLALVVLTGVAVVWHMRRPALHALEGVIFLARAGDRRPRGGARALSPGGVPGAWHPWGDMRATLLTLLVALALVAPAAARPVDATIDPLAPTADFAASPATPTSGDTVAFTAGASGVGDLSYSWDLDGDGSFGEEGETGAQVSHVFLAPGAHVVRLVVTDSSGRSTRVEHSVSVRTPPPRAELLALPAAPRVGQEVTFVSLSRAPYGSIATEEWDLDGDGAFDDGNGPRVTWTFGRAGRHPVALRVTDTQGSISVARETVPVSRRPAARPVALSPFPVVRLRGQLRRGGIAVQLLSVLAPRGATIGARCRPGCGGTLRRPGTGRAVRLARFERGFRAGALIELRIMGAGRIGKYVSLRVVGGRRGYVRRDACLAPGSSRPVRCAR